MEDVFQLPSFFNRGGKWVTVKELSADGLTAVLETFPGINKEVVEVLTDDRNTGN
jgi:hypothetical protein